MILEGANGPTYPKAEDVLVERGIVVVPDVVCNAGGVTVSYFEWVQDMASYFWSEEEINERLDKLMVQAMDDVWNTANKNACTLRTAAYILACERILKARKNAVFSQVNLRKLPFRKGGPSKYKGCYRVICSVPFLNELN